MRSGLNGGADGSGAGRLRGMSAHLAVVANGLQKAVEVNLNQLQDAVGIRAVEKQLDANIFLVVLTEIRRRRLGKTVGVWAEGWTGVRSRERAAGVGARGRTRGWRGLAYMLSRQLHPGALALRPRGSHRRTERTKITLRVGTPILSEALATWSHTP